jgi:hypothetical protein
MLNTCKYCGKSFEPSTNGRRGREQKYCSRRCGLKGSKPVREVVCENCGVVFTHHGRGRCKNCPVCREVKNKQRVADWQTKHRTKNPGVGSGGAQWGENNHQYTGGKSGYKGSYRSRCFKNHEPVCILCSSERHIDVHHINGDKTDYSASNLVPLCKSCHKKVHNAISRLIPEDVFIAAFESVEAEIKSRNKAGTA